VHMGASRNALPSAADAVLNTMLIVPNLKVFTPEGGKYRETCKVGCLLGSHCRLRKNTSRRVGTPHTPWPHGLRRRNGMLPCSRSLLRHYCVQLDIGREGFVCRCSPRTSPDLHRDEKSSHLGRPGSELRMNTRGEQTQQRRLLNVASSGSLFPVGSDVRDKWQVQAE
jgi:hypothetical protein